MRALSTIACAIVLHAGAASADEMVQLRELEASRLNAERFLELVQQNGVRAICDDGGVRDCFSVSKERCNRSLDRASPRCLEDVRRLIRVTGVTGAQLNASYLAQYASCVIDRTATVRVLELARVRACIAAESDELARLWSGERD